MARQQAAIQATISVDLAPGTLTSGKSSPQSVIDAAFALSTALFAQSSNSAVWTSQQLQLFVSERRETTTLLQRVEAEGSRLHTAEAVELKTAADLLAQASRDIRAAQSVADLGAAIPLVNSAQMALSELGRSATT